MRLVSFTIGEPMHVGKVVGGGVIDLTQRIGVSSIRELIATGRIGEAEAVSGPTDHSFADVQLGLPIPDPNKIICVGVNYMNRNEEYKDGSEAPKYPSLFMRTPLSFVPHGHSVVIPHESEQLDYEGEIVLVIGKAGRRIAQADAMNHVAGLTLMNEGSVRDWIRHGKFNVTPGKNFDRSGSIGPWIETDLAAIDVDNMRLETRVNGELRQSDTSANMAFSFRRIVEYVSSFCTLLPGDLIATGTPTGAGARFDPPRWLKAGDRIEVSSPAIGMLTNWVVHE